jgi:hypothetical protein
LLLGIPVTKKLKSAYNGIKGLLSKSYKYIKGVSAGGEEFTHKLDQLLQA